MMFPSSPATRISKRFKNLPDFGCAEDIYRYFFRGGCDGRISIRLASADLGNL